MKGCIRSCKSGKGLWAQRLAADILNKKCRKKYFRSAVCPLARHNTQKSPMEGHKEDSSRIMVFFYRTIQLH